MNQTTKQLIPCLYLYQGSAVAGFSDRRIVSMKPEELAASYEAGGADALLVYDLSTGDREHEENLDRIKALCARVDIPVIGAGNIRRMEDVKKLLYAGCSRAALHYEKESNVALTQEVSLKFGADKIAACIADPETAQKNRELLAQYVSLLILVNASGSESLREEAGKLPLPLIVCVPPLPLDRLIRLLSAENIAGLSGDGINENTGDIRSLKQICERSGIPVFLPRAEIAWEQLKKNTDGLVPVVVQEDQTDQVLMVAYMNEEAFQQTIQSGKMTYYSRSRQCLWLKGETSGHYQFVRSLTADCDLDTILARVSQIGAACHTGSHSCFFQPVLERTHDRQENPLRVFEDVYGVILDRRAHPKEGSYTNYLFDKGLDKILKKLGEEATEIVIAAKNPNGNEVKYEIADFLYHMMVLMAEKDISWEEITRELANR